MGGTFTDVVMFEPRTGTLSALKVPTSRDPSTAAVHGLTILARNGYEVTLVSHATTIATNALLTHSGLARTALITNEGFRDVLEIARQRRPELYDIYTRRPVPLVGRRDRFTVRCRLKFDGSELQPLDKRGARAVARRIVHNRFESVAICFLNSYANPIHERNMARILLEAGFKEHVSLSSEVDREHREYERSSTTVVNAALAPPMSRYLAHLSASLRRRGIGAPVYVMNSDGGMTTPRSASARPVSAIESGPAAGVLASRQLAMRLGLSQVLTFDMGGTTAKAGAVIDYDYDVTSEFEAAGRTHSGRSIRGSGYAVRGSFIDLAEVSAGGGTVAWLDEGAALTVGPRSAGSEPGPACYGRGGKEPTVTDANVVLGRINPEYLLGGKMKVHSEFAASSLRGLAAGMGATMEAAAVGVIRLVNNSMAKAISIVSSERARDPRDFTMISFGGAGPVHACDLAEELGIRAIIAPAHAGLFSAYGLLAGDLSRTFTLPVLSARSQLSSYFSELEKIASKEMKLDGLRTFSSKRYVDARYKGQSHELTLPFTGEAKLRKSFDVRHKELYGYSSPDPSEVVSVRLMAVVHRAKPGVARSTWEQAGEPTRTRRAWFAGRRHTALVFTREHMRPGDRGFGPCVIEEYDSTLVVNPGWRWSTEEYGTRVSR